MRVLAIDSSGLVATVAIMEEEYTLAEYTVDYKKTHSQTLLPMLDEIVKMTELDLQTIDAIAISGGPGSFTGLRIGSATAKGLGLALNKPLIHIPTLDGLAFNMYGCKEIVCPIMDARRNQVYTGFYTFLDQELRIIERPMAIAVEEVIMRLNGWNRPVVFLGDGVPVYRELLRKGLKIPYTFAPPHLNRQRAAAVGALGLRYLKQGKTETAMEHQPDYLRLSQAERERAEKEKAEREMAQKIESCEIRDMGESDILEIARLEQEVFPDPWSEKSLWESLHLDASKCVIAECEGKLAGYFILYETEGEAEVIRIAVGKELQGKGVGKLLMKHIEQYCEQQAITKILLDVRTANTAARSFYKKHGFVEDGVRPGFYENPSEDAVLMSRELGSSSH